MNEYIGVIDCARRVDRFALMISRNIQKIVPGEGIRADRLIAELTIAYLDQWSGIAYADMVQECVKILGHRSISYNIDILIDATGVGDAIVQLFRSAGIFVTPIIVTGGKAVREVYEGLGAFRSAEKMSGMRAMKELHIPKAELVAAGQVMLENRRVGIARGLKWKDELQRQLAHMSGKQTLAGNTKYESDDNQIHDDIAFCFILSAWWAQRRLRDGIVDTTDERPAVEWDPLEQM